MLVGARRGLRRKEEPEMANEVVNPQVTDAVTQSHVENVASSPAMAMAQLYQASSQALANAAHNATTAQQNANAIQQAATTYGVALLLSVDKATDAVGVAKILETERGPGKEPVPPRNE
jgi:hypothetical protein